MSAEPTQEELNESITALKNYRDRLRKELITISQKLRMPQKKIDLTLKENNELQEIESAIGKLLEKINENYNPPKKPIFKLPGQSVRDKMYEVLENLKKNKKILDHGMDIGKQLAFVLSGGNTSIEKELSEDDLYALELEAFMNLIQMPKTQERIKHTLETGKPLVN